MCPGIIVHDHLTKTHEDFRISYHLLPASKGFPKSNFTTIPLGSGRGNQKISQKSNICEIFEIFDHFESLHEGTMSFHFVIFSEFGSQIMTSGKINDVRSGS